MWVLFRMGIYSDVYMNMYGGVLAMKCFQTDHCRAIIICMLWLMILSVEFPPHPWILNVVHHSMSFPHYGLNIHLCMCFFFIRLVQETFTEQGLQGVEEVAYKTMYTGVRRTQPRGRRRWQGGRQWSTTYKTFTCTMTPYSPSVHILKEPQAMQING